MYSILKTSFHTFWILGLHFATSNKKTQTHKDRIRNQLTEYERVKSTLTYAILHWTFYRYCFLTGRFPSTSFLISHLLRAIIQCWSQGPYSEPFQTSKTENFVKVVYDFWPLTLFEKCLILDVWQGSKYASVSPNRVKRKYEVCTG